MKGHQVFIRKKPAYDVVSQDMSQRIAQAVHIQVSCTVYVLYEIAGLSLADVNLLSQEILGDPVTDEISHHIETSEQSVLAYTYLAGHFDQRAYYAQQAGMLILPHDNSFTVRSSTIVCFDHLLSQQDYLKIETYLINPVDTRKRSLSYETPPKVFCKDLIDLAGFPTLSPIELETIQSQLNIALNRESLRYIQRYYQRNNRIPTETELVLFDTYWSDHCRHTTFLTPLHHISFSGRFSHAIEQTFQKYLEQRKEIGRTGDITLMDLATHSQRYLRATGRLSQVEHSAEVNACSVMVSDTHGEYLLMFKNETHNHPTEIEPFGGAQTCLGGAIRDPLSGRSYVYQGLRISGSADITADVSQTLVYKLPQATIARESARGFSSYGNQIGMATTLVKEIYHPSYVAKHLELGAVVGITRKDEVVREEPLPGDIVVLLGGRTGKDGIGGASGSSVSHTKQSLDTSYAQIQKGNPLEERKLQRLFRIPEVKRMIKRSNDFGAGGVSVAIGELAPGISINLDAIPLKTLGMNPTEIAVSESQERMAVVIDPKHLSSLITYATQENVQAVQVATVTAEHHLIMYFQGEIVVDIDRDFLDTNGPIAAQDVSVTDYHYPWYDRNRYNQLNKSSQKGLAELFDSSVGNATLFAPYGGKTQRTPELSSVQRFPLHGDSDKASVVSYGFNPVTAETSVYLMGMESVISSVAKQVATGATLADIHLSFQEYFPKLQDDPERWGLVLQALLGAFAACDALSLAAIGGKDSMSGSYEDLDVIPTLVSFAFGEVAIKNLRSRAFSEPDEYIYILKQATHEGLPDMDSLRDNIEWVTEHREDIHAISTLEEGLLHTLDLMSFGNEIGYTCTLHDTQPNPGGFVFTTKKQIAGLTPIGRTVTQWKPSSYDSYHTGLQRIYPIVHCSTHVPNPIAAHHPKRYYHSAISIPIALIITFSGTNSELDMEMHFSRAGAEPRILVINDTSQTAFAKSVERFIEELAQAHILVFPGGFSFADEPDGSGKFIAAFLKQKPVAEAVQHFIDSDHLVLGICNGFQGLIKSGLLPYGSITERKAGSPTLCSNDSYHHVATLVRTAIRSTRSPWLQELDPKLTYTLPVSHAEGKFIASEEQLAYLVEHDLIATTYIDNPNGSVMHIEGIVSENGNILGKMAHNERISDQLFINVEGTRGQDIFTSGVKYFQLGGNNS